MKAVAASFFYEPGDRESYIYNKKYKRILRDFASLIFAIPPNQNEWNETDSDKSSSLSREGW